MSTDRPIVEYQTSPVPVAIESLPRGYYCMLNPRYGGDVYIKDTPKGEGAGIIRNSKVYRIGADALHVDWISNGTPVYHVKVRGLRVEGGAPSERKPGC